MTVDPSAGTDRPHADLLRLLRAAVAGTGPDAPPADWPATLTLAVRHEVDAFLFFSAGRWSPALLPAGPLLDRWRTAFLAAAARYTRVTLQAGELLGALRAAGILAVPLKGVWLAERIYEEGACRAMNDLDLLVPPASLAAASEAICRLGYEVADAGTDRGHFKHARLRRAGAPLPLELHADLWARGEPAADARARLWSGLLEERLHGEPVAVFPAERQMIYLAQHILHHELAVPLKACVDLVLLARREAPSLEAGRWNEEAQAWGLPFGAGFVVQVAHDLLGQPLPASLGFLVDGRFESERHSAAAVFLGLTHGSKHVTQAQEAYARVRGWPRLRLAVSRLFLPAREIRSNYPRVVLRWGLAGGYCWRGIDLLLRKFRMRRLGPAEKRELEQNLAGASARQQVVSWIRQRDSTRRAG